MLAFFHTIVYQPLYNILILFYNIIPGKDFGISIILITVLLRTVLIPLYKKQIESQKKLQELQPKIKALQEKTKGDKEQQTRQLMELYKEHKTNPFSGCLLVLIQIPIIFALYYVFLKGIKIDSSMLYSFVHAPANVNMLFLGILDISQKGLIVLALLAGISQYFQAVLMPKPATQNKDSKSFQDNLTSSMQTQMKYVFPFVIAFIAYSVSGAVALYWITSNIFAIGQQLYANKKRKLALEAVNK